MRCFSRLRLAALSLAVLTPACAAAADSTLAPPEGYDAALAEKLGADEYGMRAYVLAILTTGPRDAAITDKDERAALFAGHFSTIARLAEEGHLVLAGPLGGEYGRRGLFILNTPDIETAKALVAADPTVEAGVFTVQYSKYYGSAALLLINEVHPAIQKTRIGG